MSFVVSGMTSLASWGLPRYTQSGSTAVSPGSLIYVRIKRSRSRRACCSYTSRSLKLKSKPSLSALALASSKLFIDFAMPLFMSPLALTNSGESSGRLRKKNSVFVCRSSSSADIFLALALFTVTVGKLPSSRATTSSVLLSFKARLTILLIRSLNDVGINSPS